ncbi:type VI secretion system tube protein TssD [Cochleicola gelatinilyticus]|uniref:Uncharacterized protein n=1 Tax=Cochleicola gelatinilyticus TaxID=1763537 RepID=A0A167F245_9FLAO|nr:type VI secretion system tube protein TssD [Cochleicola gelatinilyticus]OAB76110.1 hypothetical protein ULVI_13715 [Cochleicola gelatinilyticus]
MSFKAKLFIEDQERNILDAHLLYHRFSDLNGKPTSKPIGGPLEFTIESTGNDSLFYENMFSPTVQCQGEIIFYKRDGFSTLFKIEFANAHFLGLEENFSASGDEPLYMNITIGWGIIKVRGVVFEEYWNPNNPFVEQAAPTEIVEEEPLILESYFENEDGEKVSGVKKDQKVYLVLKTENMAGKSVDIDLSDHPTVFEYQGQPLANNIMQAHSITADVMKIELTTIKKNSQ